MSGDKQKKYILEDCVASVIQESRNKRKTYLGSKCVLWSDAKLFILKETYNLK